MSVTSTRPPPWWVGVWISILMLLSMVPLGEAETKKDCLYFTNSNSRLSIVKRWNDTSYAQFIDVVPLLGYNPSGLIIYNDTAYVATTRQIEFFSTAILPAVETGKIVTTIFADFANYIHVFVCNPRALEINNNVLYVACLGGFPYSILQFSLNGTFLGGLQALRLTNIFDMLVMDRDTPDAVLYFSEQSTRTLYRLPVGGDLASIMASNPYLLARGDQFPNSTSTTWRGIAEGPDQIIYVIEFSVFTDTITSQLQRSRILSYNLTTGAFIKVVSIITESTANAANMCLTPELDTMYILVPLLVSPSYVYRYSTDGVPEGYFYNGSNIDEIVPQFCQWWTCPALLYEEDSDSGDAVSDTVLIIVVLFSILFVIVICISLTLMVLISGATIYSVNIFQGRRRVWEDLEAQQELKIFNAQSTEYAYREIDPKELQFSELLGKGAYGRVYRGQWRGVTVAIKTLEGISFDCDQHTLHIIREEAHIMCRLGNHPNVVTFLGAVTVPAEKPENMAALLSDEDSDRANPDQPVPGFLCLVLEYCPKGSLYDCIIKRREKIPFATLIRIARDVANGLSHLHQEKVIHRDIALRNVLVGHNYEVYISDFGMARLQKDDIHTTKSTVGPVAWMAPESMLRREYSEASDVFSFGVMLWEMIAKREPWRGVDAAKIIIAVAKENTRLKIPDDCDPVLSSIISSCWKVKPEKRITMEQIRTKLNNYLEKLETLYADFVMTSADNFDRMRFEESNTPSASLLEDGIVMSVLGGGMGMGNDSLNRILVYNNNKSNTSTTTATSTSTPGSSNVSFAVVTNLWDSSNSNNHSNRMTSARGGTQEQTANGVLGEEGEGFRLALAGDFEDEQIHYEEIVIDTDDDETNETVRDDLHSHSATSNDNIRTNTTTTTTTTTKEKQPRKTSSSITTTTTATATKKGKNKGKGKEPRGKGKEKEKTKSKHKDRDRDKDEDKDKTKNK